MNNRKKIYFVIAVSVIIVGSIVATYAQDSWITSPSFQNINTGRYYYDTTNAIQQYGTPSGTTGSTTGGTTDNTNTSGGTTTGSSDRTPGGCLKSLVPAGTTEVFKDRNTNKLYYDNTFQKEVADIISRTGGVEIYTIKPSTGEKDYDHIVGKICLSGASSIVGYIHPEKIEQAKKDYEAAAAKADPAGSSTVKIMRADNKVYYYGGPKNQEEIPGVEGSWKDNNIYAKGTYRIIGKITHPDTWDFGGVGWVEVDKITPPTYTPTQTGASATDTRNVSDDTVFEVPADKTEVYVDAQGAVYKADDRTRQDQAYYNVNDHKIYYVREGQKTNSSYGTMKTRTHGYINLDVRGTQAQTQTQSEYSTTAVDTSEYTKNEDTNSNMTSPSVRVSNDTAQLTWKEYRGRATFNAYAVYMKKGSDFTESDLAVGINPVSVDYRKTQHTFYDLEPGTYYFKLGVGMYDTNGKWKSYGNTSETVSATTQTSEKSEHTASSENTGYSFEVSLTSAPEYTRNSQGRYGVEVKRGETLTFTRKIKSEGVVNNAWNWNVGDKTRLDCKAYPEFDSPDLKCETLKPGNTVVSITMFPEMSDGTKRTIESNLIYVTVKEKIQTPPIVITDHASGKGEDGKPSITLWFNGPELGSGDKYHATCQELGAGGIDSPSYKRLITVKLAVISPLKENTDYRCQVMINKADGGYVSQSETVDVKTKKYTEEQTEDTHPAATATDNTAAETTEYENGVTEADAKTNPFSDTKLENLEGKAAAHLNALGVIGGYPDGEFKGRKAVNRAEAAKFLLLAAGITVENIPNNGRFWDVLDGEWYTKYVMTAAKYQIIGGYPDGSFKPADGVKTIEFLKMIAGAFKLKENLPYTYTDFSADQWFAKYAGIAQTYKLFPKRASLVEPKENLGLSREEVAIAIYNYLNR